MQSSKQLGAAGIGDKKQKRRTTTQATRPDRRRTTTTQTQRTSSYLTCIHNTFSVSAHGPEVAQQGSSSKGTAAAAAADLSLRGRARGADHLVGSVGDETTVATPPPPEERMHGVEVWNRSIAHDPAHVRFTCAGQQNKDPAWRTTNRTTIDLAPMHASIDWRHRYVHTTIVPQNTAPPLSL